VPADVNDPWYPPAPAVIEALHRALDYISFSPDPWNDSLREYISSHYGIPFDATFLDAGSSPLHERILRGIARPGGNIVLPNPTYTQYAAIADALNIEVRQAQLKCPNFKINTEEILRCVNKNTCAVVLVNPNNPTGEAWPANDVLALSDSLPEDVVLLVDETYIDYSEDCSVLGYVPSRANLGVTRSFSKGFALAGLRLGFALLGPRVCAVVRTMIETPWRINLLADVAGRIALANTAYVRARIAETVALREDLLAQIASIDGLMPLPTDTNFFMVCLSGRRRSGLDLVNALVSDGVLVRFLPDLSQTGYDYLRISTRSATENRKVFTALCNSLKGYASSAKRENTVHKG
jgi:histidinol-phosphate/aromatic aminotransferase/cobyric acid decarboxylase-like protein